jgi:hypothetical protein
MGKCEKDEEWGRRVIDVDSGNVIDMINIWSDPKPQKGKKKKKKKRRRIPHSNTNSYHSDLKGIKLDRVTMQKSFTKVWSFRCQNLEHANGTEVREVFSLKKFKKSGISRMESDVVKKDTYQICFILPRDSCASERHMKSKKLHGAPRLSPIPFAARQRRREAHRMTVATSNNGALTHPSRHADRDIVAHFVAQCRGFTHMRKNSLYTQRSRHSESYRYPAVGSWSELAAKNLCPCPAC